MKKCPYCNAEIQDDAIKCRYCGEFLAREAKAPIPQDSIKFPKIWPGYILALLFIVFAVGKAILNPEATKQLFSIWSILIWLIGLVYWNICVYKIHKVILTLTDNCYPISPARAVGFGFIPFYNLYWMFKWPSEILNFIRTRSNIKTWGLAIPGLLFLLSAIAGRLDRAIWLVIDFAVLSYLVNKLKESFVVTPEPLPYKSKPSSLSVGAIIAIAILPAVFIIGLLAAIAIPNFIKAKEVALKNACIANMKQIEGAVEVWRIDTNPSYGSKPTKKDLVGVYLKRWPSCEDKNYEIPAAGEKPKCPSLKEGHTI